ncbi:MAG: nucleotide pyrophosphatase [Angelakisella sp.]|nr:nucleotide pyrophosphatase [Angelakisella sp.]
MAKTILVLLDACRYDTGTENAGYLEHLIDYGKGAKYRVRGELPSMSRPMYETSLTGLPSSVHGITHNQVVRPSAFPNVFSLCRQQGLVTAAAAYQWMSELYSRPGRFDPLRDRWEFLRETYRPDFLLFHSMNVDYWGHQKGSASPEYTQAVATVMEQISLLLPRWQADGWQVVITADHGMNAMGMHGGPTADQRTIPLYIFSPRARAGRFEEKEISQLNLAPLLCRLLELPPAQGMLTELQIHFAENGVTT